MIESFFRDRIVNNTDLVAILGTRVYTVHVPDHEYPLPWVMYRIQSTDPETDLSGEIVTVKHIVRIDVLAKTYAESIGIEQLIIQALHTWPNQPRPSVAITCILFEGSAKSPRDEGYQVEMNFAVHADKTTILPTSGTPNPMPLRFAEQTLPPQSYAENLDGDPVDCNGWPSACMAILSLGQMFGTLTARVQESHDQVTFVDVTPGTFPTLTVGVDTHLIGFTRTRRYVRVRVDLSGTADLSVLIAAA